MHLIDGPGWLEHASRGRQTLILTLTPTLKYRAKRQHVSHLPSHPPSLDGAGTHEALLMREARLVIGLRHGGPAVMDLNPTLIQFGSTHSHSFPSPSIHETLV